MGNRRNRNVAYTEKSSTNDKTIDEPTETNENRSIHDPSKSLTRFNYREKTN